MRVDDVDLDIGLAKGAETVFSSLTEVVSGFVGDSLRHSCPECGGRPLSEWVHEKPANGRPCIAAYPMP